MLVLCASSLNVTLVLIYMYLQLACSLYLQGSLAFPLWARHVYRHATLRELSAIVHFEFSTQATSCRMVAKKNSTFAGCSKFRDRLKHMKVGIHPSRVMMMMMMICPHTSASCTPCHSALLPLQRATCKDGIVFGKISSGTAYLSTRTIR